MQVTAIIWEEREERALRKAEMEAQKVGEGGQGQQGAGHHCCGAAGRWWAAGEPMAASRVSLPGRMGSIAPAQGFGFQGFQPSCACLAMQAANMLEHEDEIRARPARTWFQTERQKRELAQRSKAAAAGAGGGQGALSRSAY